MTCKKHRTPGISCGWCEDQAELKEKRAEVERLRAELADSLEWETRPDGARVRADRWEFTVRRIVALLWGNRKEFECDEVVEAVRALLPGPRADSDDEALLHAVQTNFGA